MAPIRLLKVVAQNQQKCYVNKRWRDQPNMDPLQMVGSEELKFSADMCVFNDDGYLGSDTGQESFVCIKFMNQHVPVDGGWTCIELI